MLEEWALQTLIGVLEEWALQTLIGEPAFHPCEYLRHTVESGHKRLGTGQSSLSHVGELREMAVEGVASVIGEQLLRKEGDVRMATQGVPSRAPVMSPWPPLGAHSSPALPSEAKDFRGAAGVLRCLKLVVVGRPAPLRAVHDVLTTVRLWVQSCRCTRSKDTYSSTRHIQGRTNGCSASSFAVCKGATRSEYADLFVCVCWPPQEVVYTGASWGLYEMHDSPLGSRLP